MGACCQKVRGLAADYPMPVVCIWAFTFFYGAVSRAPFIFAVHYLVGETKKGIDSDLPACVQAQTSDQDFSGICHGQGCLGGDGFGLDAWGPAGLYQKEYVTMMIMVLNLLRVVAAVGSSALFGVPGLMLFVFLGGVIPFLLPLILLLIGEIPSSTSSYKDIIVSATQTAGTDEWSCGINADPICEGSLAEAASYIGLDAMSTLSNCDLGLMIFVICISMGGLSEVSTAVDAFLKMEILLEDMNPKEEQLLFRLNFIFSIGGCFFVFMAGGMLIFMSVIGISWALTLLAYAFLRPAQAKKWKLSLDDVHQFLVMAEMEDQKNEITQENIADFLGADAPMPEGFMETNRRKASVKANFADLVSADLPAELMPTEIPKKKSLTDQKSLTDPAPTPETTASPDGSADDPNNQNRRRSSLRRSVRRASAKANGEPSVRRASIQYLEAQMMVKQAAPKKRRASIFDIMMDPLGLEASADIAEEVEKASSKSGNGVLDGAMGAARASLSAARKSLAVATGQTAANMAAGPMSGYSGRASIRQLFTEDVEEDQDEAEAAATTQKYADMNDGEKRMTNILMSSVIFACFVLPAPISAILTGCPMYYKNLFDLDSWFAGIMMSVGHLGGLVTLLFMAQKWVFDHWITAPFAKPMNVLVSGACSVVCCFLLYFAGILADGSGNAMSLLPMAMIGDFGVEIFNLLSFSFMRECIVAFCPVDVFRVWAGLSYVGRQGGMILWSVIAAGMVVSGEPHLPFLHFGIIVWGCCMLLAGLFMYQGSLPFQKKRAQRQAAEMRKTAMATVQGFDPSSVHSVNTQV